MHKKHFIALAQELKTLRGELKVMDQTAWLEGYPKARVEILDSIVIPRLAAFCQAQNPQFDRERWLGYIAGENGPSGGKVKVAA